MKNLKTTNYHKLCAYNPKTDSTLWLKNYRIRESEQILFFTSDPKECALIVVDIDEIVQNFLGPDYQLMHWDLEICKLAGWLN